MTEILPTEIVIHAIFLRWEIEIDSNPDKYATREDIEQQSPTKRAEAMTACFLEHAREMGVLHK